MTTSTFDAEGVESPDGTSRAAGTRIVEAGLGVRNARCPVRASRRGALERRIAATPSDSQASDGASRHGIRAFRRCDRR